MSLDPENPARDERPPVASPFPPRRALSEAEIQERLLRCYDILLEAAAEAEARHAAQQPTDQPSSEPAP
jgi:hypothetical protein